MSVDPWRIPIEVEGYYPLTSRYLWYLEDPSGSDDRNSICLVSPKSKKDWIPDVIIFINLNVCNTNSKSKMSGAAAANGGRRVGAGNYSKDEVMYLLTIMNDVLPIGQEEWDLVVTRHSVGFPGRDVDSVRRKYASLHRKSIPTGDPSMPEEVRLAKHVKYRIGDKANIGGDDEQYNLEGSFRPNDDIDNGVLTQRSVDDTEVEVEEQPVQAVRPPSRAPAPVVAAARAPVVASAPAARQVAFQVPNGSSTSGSSSASLGDHTLAGTSSSTNRRYKINSSQDQFLDLMRMQMLKESETREAERKSREEDRLFFREAITAAAMGLAQAFGPTPKKKRHLEYQL